MHFNFYSILSIHIDRRLSAARYLATQLEYFAEESSSSTNVSFVPDDTLTTSSINEERMVGGMIYQKGDRLFVSDSTGHLAEWPVHGQECIRVHSKFKGYRLYYYLLLPLLNARLQDAGMSFIHASAVSRQGDGLLFAGWGGTGKTNLLVRLLELGCEYYGDDLAVVDRQGLLYPFPRALNLYSYNVRQSAALRSTVGRSVRWRAAVADYGAHAVAKVVPSIGSPVALLQKKLTNVSIPAGRLGRMPTGEVRLSLAVLMFAGGKVPVVTEAPVNSVVASMVANLKYEFSKVQDLYVMQSFLTGAPCREFVGAATADIILDAVSESRTKVLTVPPDSDPTLLMRTVLA